MEIDLFAGAGGWDLAARELGLDPLGIEWYEAAIATREAAGLRTLMADIAALDPADFAPCTGLIGSPPCQAWSRAGLRLGIEDQAAVYAFATAIAKGAPIPDLEWRDPRSALVVEPLRWALALLPRWVALEQVPEVLPFWEFTADHLRAAGYGVWVGKVNAADYGVPQTRERAILLASRDRQPTRPPTTHADPRRGLSMLEQPWISMADALGWGMTRRPSMTVCATEDTGGPKGLDGGSGAREQIRRAIETGDWERGEIEIIMTNQAKATRRRIDQPAPTVVGGKSHASRGWVTPGGFIVCPPSDAGILQTFPAEYPWQGKIGQVFRQIGNAIPPRLARHLLEAVV